MEKALSGAEEFAVEDNFAVESLTYFVSLLQSVQDEAGLLLQLPVVITICSYEIYKQIAMSYADR